MPDTYAHSDLSGTDFSQVDLSGQSLAHSTITGCRFGDCRGARFICSRGGDVDFRGADISGASFEKAYESVLSSLVGATWNGVGITHVSGWLVTDGYWAFVTNAFVQIGCMQKTISEWQAIGATREALGHALSDRLSVEQLDATFDWWQRNSAALLGCSDRFSGGGE
ncbi:Pentapeptide repeat [uncultured Caudovirales phage]|uniref:Pentapeptide repeat n=1 Tax=uncultured Caudovirales phage TaxID=2100421 RepID=A0A6J5Q6B3_9CAUD|nr:Pentapeptide repeat [uncultured Caudovirales phage]